MNAVTLTTAIKAVTETIVGGTTVTTGAGVSADDPLQSDVISPVNGTVAIAQGVILILVMIADQVTWRRRRRRPKPVALAPQS